MTLSVGKIISQAVETITSVPLNRCVIRVKLEEQFTKAGASFLEASELSEKHLPDLAEQLEEQLIRWDKAHIPRPVSFSSNGKVVFGLLSDKYEGRLPRNFFEVESFVHKSSDHQILGIGVLSCSLMGCDRIFVTDKGGGDSGVDVIARLMSPPEGLNLLVALQCKAYALPLAPLEVENIFHRYILGLEKDEHRWDSYRSAVDSGIQTSPLARVFGIVASNGLTEKAEEAALRRGVFSQSPKLLAYNLARSYSLDIVQDFCQRVPGTRNLNKNLALEVPRSMI